MENIISQNSQKFVEDNFWEFYISFFRFPIFSFHIPHIPHIPHIFDLGIFPIFIFPFDLGIWPWHSWNSWHSTNSWNIWPWDFCTFSFSYLTLAFLKYLTLGFLHIFSWWCFLHILCQSPHPLYYFKFINPCFYNMRCLVMFVTAVCFLFLQRCPCRSRSNCNLEMLVFVEGGKLGAGFLWLLLLRGIFQ